MTCCRLPGLAAITLASLIVGCGGGSSAPPTSNPSPSPAPTPTPPPTTPPALSVQRVFPDLSFFQPVSLKQAPGDTTHWYVVERNGVVRVFDNDQAANSSEIYVNIAARVDSSFSESGLLGLAFHPAFPSTPYVYLSYTTSGGPLVSTVSRFELDSTGLALDAASETVLLKVPQPQPNHNGGDLAFGPAGFLYAAFGDGGGSGDPGENAQNTKNLLGSVIRIDVDGAAPYEIPADNPFSGGGLCGQTLTGADCPEIFAWGLRNPWRISFDPATGSLWLGDVGQDAWEEINRVSLGQNYGWNDREGAHCFEPPSGCATGFAEPVTEYGRSLGRSVTGGHVYRGSVSAALSGWYVFGDFVNGNLFAVNADSQPTVAPALLGDAGFNISSFAVDGDGEILVTDYGNGTIHRVVAAP